jgi:hypothetical protein
MKPVMSVSIIFEQSMKETYAISKVMAITLYDTSQT